MIHTARPQLATRALLVLTAASLAACTSSTAGGTTGPSIPLARPSVAVLLASSAPTPEATDLDSSLRSATRVAGGDRCGDHDRSMPGGDAG